MTKILYKRKKIILAFSFMFLIIIGIHILPHVNQNIRPKGKSIPGLYIYKKTADSIIHLEPSSVVTNEDLLQISYIYDTSVYGAIFSIDDKNTISYLYPRNKEVVKLNSKNKTGEFFLPFSFKLDNTMHYEIFFLLTSNTLFDKNSIIQSILDQDNITEFSRKKIDNVDIETILLFKGDCEK